MAPGGGEFGGDDDHDGDGGIDGGGDGGGAARAAAAAPSLAVPPAYMGLWRRSVIRRANGVVDTSTRVWWCQSTRFHIDLRIPRARPALSGAAQLATLDAAALAAFGAQSGFAGTTHVDGARCEWRPEIAFPRVGDDIDAGIMRFDAPDRLHEAGLDGSYDEDWERAHGGPVAGLRLVASDGGPAIAYLLVGDAWLAFGHGAPDFGYAPDARAWSAFFIAERSVADDSDADNSAAAIGWTVIASNAPWHEGRRLFDGAAIDRAMVNALALGGLLRLPGHGSWRVTDRH